jgi:hypothetical protein
MPEVKVVDLGGEIEVSIPATWHCRWLGQGRWWCGEGEEEGIGVFLKQDLTDPMPSEPEGPATPLANAAYRAAQMRQALEQQHPESAVTDRATLSGRLLHAPRDLVWEGDRARQLRWFAIDGYSAAAAVFHVILNLPAEQLDEPAIQPLIAHFAREAAIGNRLPPQAEGSLRQRELRIEGGFALPVPAEWRCGGDGSGCSRIEAAGLPVIVVPRHWERAELLARLDPEPAADLPADALLRAVADHFAGNMPAGMESGTVELAPHGAVLTARQPEGEGDDPERLERLFWIYLVVGPERVTTIWFSLFLVPGAREDPELPALLEAIADCVRALRPAGEG